ncbi:hypothetical protein AQB9606_04659 [Aquabacterium sp. CECT 9606]|nr:hypothetical protein AQB9606_04659 [Aquabacterium sp. CECT 9606]
MLAIVPVNTMLASPVPSPEVKLKPVRPDKVKVPCSTLRVTCMVPPAASTSLIEIRLPLPDENTKGASSLVDCAPGLVLAGASLTAATVTVTLLSRLAKPVELVKT